MTTVVAAESVYVDAIAALLEELDTFYGGTEVGPRAVRIRQINEALFGDPPLAHAVLAWERAGTRRAGDVFLPVASRRPDPLALRQGAIRDGDGQGAELGKAAHGPPGRGGRANACSRIEWTTDRDNTQAQRFYDKLGVAQRGDKIFYRLEGQLRPATDAR